MNRDSLRTGMMTEMNVSGVRCQVSGVKSPSPVPRFRADSVPVGCRGSPAPFAPSGPIRSLRGESAVDGLIIRIAYHGGKCGIKLRSCRPRPLPEISVEYVECSGRTGVR